MASLRLLAFCWLWAAFAADASVAVPAFDPPEPTSLQSVTMKVAAGPCTFLTDGPDEVDVSIDGSDIEVIIDGVHSPFQGACPGSAETHLFHLGTFPPGQYVVHITVRDAIPPPFTLYPSLQIAPLTISAPAFEPAAIPALGGCLPAILAACLFASGLLFCRRLASVALAVVPLARN